MLKKAKALVEAKRDPDYCRTEKSVAEQLEEGRKFFARKYPDMKYLAYFQAYTNTYGDTNRFVKLYEEALATPDVVGLVIGTRPDCMPDELLDYLTELNKRTFLLVEYGIESTNDDTLQRINRGHTFAETVAKYAHHTHIVKVQPFGYHLCAYKYVYVAVLKVCKYF